VSRNPQHRSLLNVVSATSAPSFQPLRHQRNVCHPVVKRFTRQTLPTVTAIISLWISFALSPFAHKKPTRSPFLLLKPACEHAHARLLPILSWRWTVLLPSDTHRTPITSITVVLLKFVTYLLTLPGKMWPHRWGCCTFIRTCTCNALMPIVIPFGR
jgi:hypothetical protein